MIPSKKLLEQAKAKCKKYFKPNASNKMQSVILTSDEKSYTLFYQLGISYIGSYSDDPMPNFFKKRCVYELGKYAKMQRISLF